MAGVPVNWAAVIPPAGRVALPTYAFQRQRYWLADEGGDGGASQAVAESLRSAAGPEAAEKLRRQLASRPSAEQSQLLWDLVVAQASAVLGHSSAEAVDARRTFKELGFDSIAAVELRSRLGTATGLQLPVGLIYSHPTPVALAGFLTEELTSHSERAVVTGAAPIPADDPIAIVAMSCRLPGDVYDPEGLWDLLASGTDATGPLPTNRGWKPEERYDPDPDHAGMVYVRDGAFMHDAGEFDPGFFGISPREALAMDPQQRLLLELSWEAFERAGIDPELVRGSQTGVFIGASHLGYGEGKSPATLEGHLQTGVATSVLSGRVAYVFGLQGPTVTVDTACSSSLVALHLACQSLRAGECTLALAGGVTVLGNMDWILWFSRQRGLALDGRCKAFSAAADGFGVGEGAVTVLLERLADARRNGHQVLAVVRGSAVNSDGASNGMTAPSGPAQERVIRAALATARLSPGDVDAVEAHGTGTPLGDPIEAEALLATYGQGRDASRPLWLGSVKSNIAHTEWAAGTVGVIKMVLALQHQELPRTLHVGEPSPHVDWSTGQVRLLTEPVPWPAGGRLRRAGVSAFGISGTNAHVIVEEAPAADGGPARVQVPVSGSGAAGSAAGSGVVAWVVSGRSAEALAGQAERLREFAAGQPGLDPADVGWSLVTARAAFEHRAVVWGGTGRNCWRDWRRWRWRGSRAR